MNKTKISQLTALGFLLTFMSNLQQNQRKATLDTNKIIKLVLMGIMVRSSTTTVS